LFTYFTIKLEGKPNAYPPAGAPYWTTSVPVDASVFVDLKGTSGAMNSLSPNKNVHLSAKRGFSKWRLSEINCPSLKLGYFD